MTAGSAKFSIMGAPRKSATLNISGPPQVTKLATLMMAAPPHIFGTLVISRDQIANRDASLVIYGDVTSGSSSDPNLDIQKQIPITITGTAFKPTNTSFDLFLNSQPFASGVDQAPLFLRQDGTLPESELHVTASISGDITSTGGSTSNNATLQIENRKEHNQDFYLYINKDFNNVETTSLFIKSLSAENNLSVAVSGMYQSDELTTLMIRPPTSGDATLFTRGYLE